MRPGGVVCTAKGTAGSIPHEIRPAVTFRAEWDKLKEWLHPDEPLPAPDAAWLVKAFATARSETLPVLIHVGSLMGTPRSGLGFREFAVLPYEDPEWFADMVDVQFRLAAWQIRVFGENRVPVEGIHFWEDICYKNGPIISPVHFREFIVPRYRDLRDLAAGYGFRFVSVDSDGNLWALLDGWADGGVNVLLPCEVQAGMDVNEVQARFFGRVALAGGIHKHRLTGGEAEIAAELRRVKPAVERGGYIPALDHQVPADVSFAQYLAYRRLKADILGIGQPVDESRVRR